MNINLNNEVTKLPCRNQWTLDDLLTFLNVNTKGIALALNNTVVCREDWQSVQLRENDRLDLFTVVAGG